MNKNGAQEEEKNKLGSGPRVDGENFSRTSCLAYTHPKKGIT